MRNATSLAIGLLAIVLLAPSSRAAELKLPARPENYCPNPHLKQRAELKPLIDTPLRHTYITLGSDDAYYLTGTVSAEGKGRDFQNNDGVYLWKSADLKAWQPLAKVWDIEKDAKKGPGGAWQHRRNLNPDDPTGPMVRGVTAPEIHFHKGTWWIAYSMNGHGTGLLRSTSGRPEGPYEDVGRITAGEGSPTLFEDFDGAVYWVWGPGRIAKMKDDLTGLAGPTRQLTAHASYALTSRTPKLHFPESVSIFKTNAGPKRYFLVVESGSCRLGTYTRDAHIFSSESLFGPYANDGDLKHSDLLLEHGAQSTVFQDAKGNWYATFYGADGKAVWRDRAAVVPLGYDHRRGRPVRGHRTVFTERGPWTTMQPLFDDVVVNDQQMLNAPDGWYYFTGSMFGDRFRKHGLSIWKSRTLEPRAIRPDNWQEFTPVTCADIPFLAKLADKDSSVFDFTPLPWGPAKRSPRLGTWWNAEIHYLEGTFWIIGGPSTHDKAVLHMTGRNPAITGTDIYGFHRKFGPTYRQVVQGTVDRCLWWWRQRGGLITLHCHWGMPGDPDGSAWGSKNRNERVRIDLAKAVTPGTKEHKDVLGDLSVTADYLKQLAEAHVPILWRPLHEIDGSWFWWTDRKQPENTAALWRLVFDYLVKKRGIHNLIWVYNAAHVSHGVGKKDATFEDHVGYRKRFYPGAEYVDIASIDTYPNPKLGWGAPQDDARGKAYELMRRIAPRKMLAIGEDNTLLNPDIAQKEGPAWVYCLAWFAGGKVAPAAWMRKAFSHEHMITLDELPPLAGHNVAPDVRIEGLADGAALPAGPVKLEGRASDRDGNLKSVAIHVLSGTWRNWFLRKDTELAEMFPAKTRLGEAKLAAAGRWTFTWKNPPAGFHNVAAFARDADGAVACSNAVRVTVGLEDLARGKAATASSTSKHGGPPAEAVDGDPTTMWWSDRKQPDPQWLAVDLDAVREVGAVAVTWWKAYARSAVVEVSPDGNTWIDVADMPRKSNFYGDMDLFRFRPVRTRHVRLRFENPAVKWQSYTIFDFRVYGPIPGGGKGEGPGT